MQMSARSRPDFAALLSFWMLAGFLVILWIAGGASRADVSGQVVTRFFAWLLLIAYVVLSPRFDWRRVLPVAIFVGLAILVTAIQLIPLPPAIWTSLPGRSLFVQAAEIAGQPQPWRPISISPSATVNALGSLIVPVTVLVLAANLNREQHRRIAGFLLILVVAGCLLGLLKFSGARFDNPFINESLDMVSGNFANRNHFALFIAIGCLLAPVWGFRGKKVVRWKAIAAVAVLPFFALLILATGSRMGLLVGAIGIAAGFLVMHRAVLRELRALPRSVAIGLVAGAVVAFVALVALSVTLDRAVSITRAIDLNASEDLRRRALPVVLDMIGRYFPVGSGLGAFDPVYRITEPDRLLKYTYFNHAHDDWIELVLDGGIVVALLLAGAVLWWIAAGIRAWKRPETDKFLPRTAFAMILLIMLASIVDYPARTPMMMAILTLAGIWLGNASPERSQQGFALPA